MPIIAHAFPVDRDPYDGFHRTDETHKEAPILFPRNGRCGAVRPNVGGAPLPGSSA